MSTIADLPSHDTNLPPGVRQSDLDRAADGDTCEPRPLTPDAAVETVLSAAFRLTGAADDLLWELGDALSEHAAWLVEAAILGEKNNSQDLADIGYMLAQELLKRVRKMDLGAKVAELVAKRAGRGPL